VEDFRLLIAAVFKFSPLLTFTIGMFGGETVGMAIFVNALIEFRALVPRSKNMDVF
jgi:hypothetical protein